MASFSGAYQVQPHPLQSEHLQLPQHPQHPQHPPQVAYPMQPGYPSGYPGEPHFVAHPVYGGYAGYAGPLAASAAAGLSGDGRQLYPLNRSGETAPQAAAPSAPLPAVAAAAAAPLAAVQTDEAGKPRSITALFKMMLDKLMSGADIGPVLAAWGRMLATMPDSAAVLKKMVAKFVAQSDEMKATVKRLELLQQESTTRENARAGIEAELARTKDALATVRVECASALARLQELEQAAAKMAEQAAAKTAAQAAAKTAAAAAQAATPVAAAQAAAPVAAAQAAAPVAATRALKPAQVVKPTALNYSALDQDWREFTSHLGEGVDPELKTRLAQHLLAGELALNLNGMPFLLRNGRLEVDSTFLDALWGQRPPQFQNCELDQQFDQCGFRRTPMCTCLQCRQAKSRFTTFQCLGLSTKVVFDKIGKKCTQCNEWLKPTPAGMNLHNLCTRCSNRPEQPVLKNLEHLRKDVRFRLLGMAGLAQTAAAILQEVQAAMPAHKHLCEHCVRGYNVRADPTTGVVSGLICAACLARVQQAEGVCPFAGKADGCAGKRFMSDFGQPLGTVCNHCHVAGRDRPPTVAPTKQASASASASPAPAKAAAKPVAKVSAQPPMTLKEKKKAARKMQRAAERAVAAAPAAAASAPAPAAAVAVPAPSEPVAAPAAAAPAAAVAAPATAAAPEPAASEPAASEPAASAPAASEPAASTPAPASEQ